MTSLFEPNTAYEDKMHSPHRELIVRPMEGKQAKQSHTGLLDPGIFTGTNSLHAFMDETGLWFCKYERGILPEPLKQRFTSLSKLLSFTKDYFGKRNLEIVEVKDIHATF